jgi:hypothetical protein
MEMEFFNDRKHEEIRTGSLRSLRRIWLHLLQRDRERAGRGTEEKMPALRGGRMFLLWFYRMAPPEREV